MYFPTRYFPTRYFAPRFFPGSGSGGGGPPPAPSAETPLGALLLALQAQLMTRLGFPAERVLLVDPDKFDLHPHGDQYLWVWPSAETPDLPIFLGAARYDFRESVRVEVGVRTRMGADEYSSALAWLTDATLGHALARHLVWDALLNFSPVDGDGNWLALAPIEPATGGRPRLRDTAFEWGESVLGFDVLYDPALTLPPDDGGLP